MKGYSIDWDALERIDRQRMRCRMSAEAKQPQGLVPGRIVHYQNGPKCVLPAVVVVPFSEHPNKEVLLCVFFSDQPRMKTAPYDAKGKSGTWHWMFEGQENRYRSEPPSAAPKLFAEGTIEELKREVGFTKDAIGCADERVKQHEREYHAGADAPARPEGVEKSNKIDWEAVPTVDPWAHRSAKMRCETCMFFVHKETAGGLRSALGRCRRHNPIVSQGWPAVYDSDWCGDHKLDENKA
jgi:hypothetical protein